MYYLFTTYPVFVDQLSKMAHLAALLDEIDGVGTAKLFINCVFRQHGLPLASITDRDPLDVLIVNLTGAWHQVKSVHSGSSVN